MKKEYTKGNITIVWQPDLCIHSAICVQNLPEVFKPRERPWIQMEHGRDENIIETVRKCPSGAISIKQTDTPPASEKITIPEGSRVTIIMNGPAKVAGVCYITHADGTVEERLNGVSICRCGQSSKKPFCDGSHKTNGFIG